MSEKNRILYLEDQNAESIVKDLEAQGFLVETTDVEDTEKLIQTLKEGYYRAFIMDYRLTSGKGEFDAPALAGMVRTQVADGKISINAPIILITEEKQLTVVKMEQEDQYLYDYVIPKDIFLEHIDYYSLLIREFIEAYELIQASGDCIAKVLGIDSEEKDLLVDYRLEDEYLKLKDDFYACTHFLTNYFVRSNGSLIDNGILAARLGIDSGKSGKSWDELLKILKSEGCRYTGIMSNAFSKWWMEKVKIWWKKTIPEMPSFRYENASSRVDWLNKRIGLNLVKANPIEEDMSEEYWTVCLATHQPMDPTDGFICNRRFKREWEENDYISVKGALICPEFQKYLSRVDRKDIIAYGERAGRK